MPAFSQQFSDTEGWLAAMRECLDALAKLPNESDVKRAEWLLRLAHTRRAAPIREIWKTATVAGNLDQAIAACDFLGEPKGGILLTAIAAHFAEMRDQAAFDRVWPLVTQTRPHADSRGSVPHAALAQCVAFRPAAVVELMRVNPQGASAALKILSRRAPADVVASVFKAIEDARLNAEPEDDIITSLMWGGRAELAWACLPHIQNTVTLRRDNSPDVVTQPSERRDAMRFRAVQGLTRLHRFAEAEKMLSTYEDEGRRASDAIDLHVAMGEPLKARDILVGVKNQPSILAFGHVANALGEAGEVEAAMEAADVAGRFHSKSFAADVRKDALEAAIKAGHGSAVETVLDRVHPRTRKKLEEQIARVSKKAGPKSIRAQAELWLKGKAEQMPETIQRIEGALPNAKPADRVFLRCALIRAQARAGQTADTQQTLAQIKADVQSIKSRAPRIDATQQAAAAMLAVGQRWEALSVMDATGAALEMGDKDEMREVVYGFVEACDALGVKSRLADLTKRELQNTGFGMFIEDHLTWQQSGSGDVAKLVARAKASGDFYTTINMLRAHRKFADAAAVLREAPKPRELAREDGSLIEEAAEFRQDAVVLDILATIGSPVPGEHPAGTSAITLLKSYMVRSAHGLPGGTLENLIHALAGPLDLNTRELADSVLRFAESGDFNDYQNPDAGERLVKEHGAWEAARTHVAALPRNDHSAYPAEALLGLAKFAMRNGLSANNVEDVLRECCDRLHVRGSHGYDFRKVLSALIHIHLEGTNVPGVKEKARTLLEAPATEFVWPFHRIHCYAVLGEWDEALALLPVTCGFQNRGNDSYYESHYPWRILKVIPLPVLRAKVAAAPTDLPAAWVLAAALSARQEKRATGFVAKLLGVGGDDRKEIMQLIKDSMEAVPKPTQ